jgi:hypothetical protein
MSGEHRLGDGEALGRASEILSSMAGQMDDGEVRDLFWVMGLQLNHCANLATPGDSPWLWGRGGRKRCFHTLDADGVALCLEDDRAELERQVRVGEDRCPACAAVTADLAGWRKAGF